MHRTARESQKGQAIVIVGAMLIALTILGTMVFDVGLAMSDRRNLQAFGGRPDQITGATKDVQDGMIIPMPAIKIGSIQILDAGVTFGDMYIFKQWKLLNQPAILIGMDALGLLDTLVIDYRRHELQMRMSRAGAG